MLHWYETFWEAQSKATRAYAQSGQYQIIVEISDSQHGIRALPALNLVMSIESSSVEQRVYFV